MYAVDLQYTLPIISEPNIISLFNKEEWQAAVGIGEANPYFAVHEQAVMKVDYGFAGACAGIG